MNDMINSHEAIRMVEDAVTAQMRGGYGNTSLLLAYEEVIRLAKIGEHAERIKELPTAQSNLQPTCNQLATDCISRQAAIEAIKKIPIYVTLDFGETCGKMPVVSPEAILYAIQNLPSAQPEKQRGEWIRHTRVEPVYSIDGVETWGIKCQCNKCCFTTTVVEDFGYYNFCPHCGADMRGDNNED